jgi:hydrogenase maturation protease
MKHLLIGVGNAFRGDDAVGLAVADRLRGCVPAGVEVVSCELEPSRLIDAWEGAASAVVVDAVASGGEAGAVSRFDASDAAVPARAFRSSTHAFGVGEAIELARALGRLPRRVVVYGIEGSEFAAGAGLTAPVQAAVARAVPAVLGDLEHLTREEGPCTSER